MGFVALDGVLADQFAAGGAHQFGRFGAGCLKGTLAGFAAAGVAVGEMGGYQHDAFGVFQCFVGVETGHGKSCGIGVDNKVQAAFSCAQKQPALQFNG